MNISVKTEARVVFTINYYEPEEGGMDTEQFGSEKETLEEAVSLLQIAVETHPNKDWVITGHVTFSIQGGRP